FRERNNRGTEGGWEKRKPDNFSPRTSEKPAESESKAVDSAVAEGGWGKPQAEATSTWTPENVPWEDSTAQSNNAKGPEGGKGGVKKGGKPLKTNDNSARSNADGKDSTGEDGSRWDKPEQSDSSRPESGKGAQWTDSASGNNSARGEGGKGKKKEGKASMDGASPSQLLPNNTPWGDNNDTAKEPKGNLNKKSDRAPKKTDDKAQWDSSESVPARGSGDNWGKPEPPTASSSWPPAESTKEDSKPEASGYKGSGPSGKDRKGPGNAKALDKRPTKGGSKWENNNPADSNKSRDQPTPAAETETSSWGDAKKSNAPESTGDGWGDAPKAASSGEGWGDAPKVASSGEGWGDAPKTDSWGAPNTNKTLGDSNQWEQAQVAKSAEWDNSANAGHGPGGAGPRSGPRSGGGPGGRNERFQRDSQEFSRREPGSGYKRYQDSAPGSEGGSYQRDARSSLDSRNSRLNSQREMHRGPRTEGGDGSRFSGPNEGRKKPQQQWKEHGGPYGQGAGSSTHPANKGPLDYAPQSNKPGADASSSTRKPAKAKEAKPLTTPMFSNSLQCQLEWKDMRLKPKVMAKILELGLTKPSNIQKLVMRPFSEGRDVIAQSQSQKDRTNTIAISLLQKINAEKKACQAVMICSEGVNPQRVQEDFEAWFEGSGISSVLLKDLNSATNGGSNGEGNEVDGNGTPATTESNGYGLAQQDQQQVVITTLGPLMEVLKKNLLEMSTVETVVISMRSDELVGFDAFKQFWASLPRDAQVVLMTGKIMPIIQKIRVHHFRANTAIVRADELTLQWSEHFYVDVDGHDHRWTTLKKIFEANSDISHTVILTQSQSATQSLTDRLKEELGLHVISVWSMADKTEVARDFNRPDKCVLVSESILMDSLDLDHYSLVINYEMPRRAAHYVSSFGPFGKSGNRSMMINLCTVQEPAQKRILDELASLYNIEVRVLKFD
ncbi:translation initiation factor eIF4A, partial [Lunasporangiospora selenospora]